MRKKLIELLGEVQDEARKTIGYGTFCFGNEKVANHLIANGVTVQKWIPVTERLPDTQDDVDWVLVNIRLMPEAYYGVPCVAELRNGDWYDAEGGLLDTSEEGCGVIVTHWMPLPEPPKGE